MWQSVTDNYAIECDLHASQVNFLKPVKRWVVRTNLSTSIVFDNADWLSVSLLVAWRRN